MTASQDTRPHPFPAPTHEVFNQPPPLERYNLYEQDQPLRDALQRAGITWAEQQLHQYGELAGHELLPLGFQANDYPPRFRSHDRFGQRVDQVEYHPAYHQLMRVAISHGLHALPWREPRQGAHLARAALVYLHNQAEAGTTCPLTMTFAAIATLRRQPELAKHWEPMITHLHYDPRDLPAEQKQGLTIGMAMTEKQGGSDVRTNTSRAFPVGADAHGDAYELVGHKWFCSAPMSDAFLTLAQAPGGLSCFLLPRWRPDGQRNAFHIQQLKNKLGNHANASAEVEFQGALAWRVGPEGRGVRTILDMVALTRFDCMIGSTSLMRQALAQATHHAAHRHAFGQPLSEQPLMQNVLADLALEQEAALLLTLRLAQALERSATHDEERLLVRLLTAVGKYWICKRAPMQIAEALECLGGAGYVEDSILPRLYREAPVNSIWEGSGNVQCLDVLRTLDKHPDALDAFVAEVAGVDPLIDAGLNRLQRRLKDRTHLEYQARSVAAQLALLLQAALLVRAGNSGVADAFCQSRLQTEPGATFGLLPSGIDCRALVERARPRIN